jgi:hypothetical protein
MRIVFSSRSAEARSLGAVVRRHLAVSFEVFENRGIHLRNGLCFWRAGLEKTRIDLRVSKHVSDGDAVLTWAVEIGMVLHLGVIAVCA